MKKSYSTTVLLIGALLFIGCEEKNVISPDQNTPAREIVNVAEPEIVANSLIAEAGWLLDPEAEISPEQPAAGLQKTTGLIQNFERHVITRKIVHYKFQVRVGSGPYDVIGIHRVVRENKPFRPARTKRTFFYQHGDWKDFEGMVLPGIRQPNTPDDFGLAVFLAEHKVDVWGIDQAWTLVPEGVSNFDFMTGWGLQKQVDDLRYAMAIARFARLLTGSGFGKMILCGYSSGVATGYALLNEETQMPDNRRHVRGYIPVDLSIKTDDEPLRQFFAQLYSDLQGLISSGIYQEDVPLRPLGNLARTDPNGNSPFIPGFTNLQAALFFGAGPISGVIPFHYFAGVWDNQLPTDFQFVTIDQVLDFYEAGVPYEPLLFESDQVALMSDAVNVPFDDYFSQISVPILNVGAAGGLGNYSIFGTGLIGSSDIMHHIVSLRPPGEELLDFGHIDLFTAPNAEALAWRPMLKWIKQH